MYSRKCCVAVYFFGKKPLVLYAKHLAKKDEINAKLVNVSYALDLREIKNNPKHVMTFSIHVFYIRNTEIEISLAFSLALSFFSFFLPKMFLSCVLRFHR